MYYEMLINIILIQLSIQLYIYIYIYIYIYNIISEYNNYLLFIIDYILINVYIIKKMTN